MHDRAPLAAVLGLAFACATADVASIPLCAPIESLSPLPDLESCRAAEVEEFEASLWRLAVAPGGRAVVRVELDEGPRVRAVCVQRGPGYGQTRARSAVAENLDAILSLPPGPSCIAGRRLDLNRYEAKLAQIRDLETRCSTQVRTSQESMQHLSVGGSLYAREFARCMEADADWVLLDRPGSTAPAIFVKPEVPDPPGRDASDTVSYCSRTAHRYEEQSACVESKGWELLLPPSLRR